jgi:hypothetical protein
MPKNAELKLLSCGLKVADFRKNCDCGIVELRLRNCDCGRASFKLRNCECGLKKKLRVPTSANEQWELLGSPAYSRRYVHIAQDNPDKH